MNFLKLLILFLALGLFAYFLPIVIIFYFVGFLIWLNRYIHVRKVRAKGLDGYAEVLSLEMLPGTEGKYESYLVEMKFQDKIYVADAVPKNYLGDMKNVRVRYIDSKKLYFYNDGWVTMLFAEVKR